MLRLTVGICAVVVIATSSAFAAEKRKAEPAPKSLESIVVDIVTAPFKLVDDLTKPLQPKTTKK